MLEQKLEELTQAINGYTEVSRQMVGLQRAILDNQLAYPEVRHTPPEETPATNLIESEDKPKKMVKRKTKKISEPVDSDQTEQEKPVKWKKREGVPKSVEPVNATEGIEFDGDEDEDEKEEGKKPITLVQVKHRLREFASKHGFDGVTKILSDFKIDRIAKLEPSLYGDFLNAIRERS